MVSEGSRKHSAITAREMLADKLPGLRGALTLVPPTLMIRYTLRVAS